MAWTTRDQVNQILQQLEQELWHEKLNTMNRLRPLTNPQCMHKLVCIYTYKCSIDSDMLCCLLVSCKPVIELRCKTCMKYAHPNCECLTFSTCMWSLILERFFVALSGFGWSWNQVCQRAEEILRLIELGDVLRSCLRVQDGRSGKSGD